MVWYHDSSCDGTLQSLHTCSFVYILGHCKVYIPHLLCTLMHIYSITNVTVIAMDHSKLFGWQEKIHGEP